MAQLLAREAGITLAKDDATCAEAASGLLGAGATAPWAAHEGSGFIALRCPREGGDRLEWLAAHSTPSLALGEERRQELRQPLREIHPQGERSRPDKGLHGGPPLTRDGTRERLGKQLQEACALGPWHAGSLPDPEGPAPWLLERPCPAQGLERVRPVAA